MKAMINKVLYPLLGAVLVGYIGGKLAFKTYRENLYSDFNSSRLYFVENGVYDDIYDMRSDNEYNNYVYYVDDNKYKSVVGITRNKQNIDKIKKLYNNDVQVCEYYVSKDKINNLQDEYDGKLLQVDDIYEVKEIVDDILSLYQNNNEIGLIKVN